MAMFTPHFFDVLIVVVIVIGLALAAVRLYRDFTRDLREETLPQGYAGVPPSPPRAADTTYTEDTEPVKPVS
ncbi:MAG: hypothetical protein U0670_04910 [Anaerolineae bacterium]